MTCRIPKLFELMKTKNITAKKLSLAIGASEGNISDWKSGKAIPSAEKLVLIADCLDCSVDYLLGRTDNPQSHIRTTEVNNELLTLISQLTTEHQELVLAQIKGILSIKKNPPPNGNG